MRQTPLGMAMPGGHPWCLGSTMPLVPAARILLLSRGDGRHLAQHVEPHAAYVRTICTSWSCVLSPNKQTAVPYPGCVHFLSLARGAG